MKQTDIEHEETKGAESVTTRHTDFSTGKNTVTF
jgi:hypothetical protein